MTPTTDSKASTPSGLLLKLRTRRDKKLKDAAATNNNEETEVE
jgi:hypothetical protein